MNQPKIILFTVSAAPTNYDRQLAAGIGMPVVYRNALTVKPTDAVEVCDGVAGVYIPVQYRNKPTPLAASTAYRNALKAEAAAPVGPKPATLTPAQLAAAKITAAAALVASWKA